MLQSVCAALVAMSLMLATGSAISAEKAFQNEPLDAQASRLEQDIKSSNVGGAVKMTSAALKKEADAAIAKFNWATAARDYSQIVATTPSDAASWFKLALVTLKINPGTDTWTKSILTPILSSDPRDVAERTRAIRRAMTEAYIAYQRAEADNDQANGLMVLGLAAAQLSNWDVALEALRIGLELRKVDTINGAYRLMLAQHGFRVVDYIVQPNAASPTVCFTFSEDLSSSRRNNFANFVAVAGQTNPMVTTADKQLCVGELKTGQRYNITLRRNLPSAAVEKLGEYAKLADDVKFDIYMSYRQPSVRFTGRAYVLPSTGQQGVPVVSVNTDNIQVDIYRIGDRNITDTVVNGSFKENLYSGDVQRIKDESGFLVWSGSLTVESKLNTEVTTAFPVDQAVPKLAAGVYVMTAQTGKNMADDGSELATQWFVVSDFGMTAFSGDDGITAFINSLANAAPKNGIQVRLLARNNEILGIKTTDANGVAQFEAGLTRGEGGLSPALLIASDQAGDYAFLNLKATAFDLSDRGVTGRPAPSGLDAFIYAERGVYRTGETVYLTTLLRDSRAIAVPGTPVTIVIERPDGVEYMRQLVQDQGLGGRSLNVAIPGAAPTGTWRVKAYADPKRSPIGFTTFMVEDYVPDRLDFTLDSTSTSISSATPVQIDLVGRYLYGAPAAGLDLDGDIKIIALDEKAGFQGYHFGLANDEFAVNKDGNPLGDLPQTDAQGKARLSVPLGDIPDSTRPLQAVISIRMSDPGGRAVEHQLNLPVVPAEPMIGIKPLFVGQSLADGDTANFDVVLVGPDGKPQVARGLRWRLLKLESQYQSYKQEEVWHFEAVESAHQINTGQVDLTSDNPGRIALRLNWGRYRLEITTADSAGPISSVRFDAGFYADASMDTPDLLEIALDKPEYRVGDRLMIAVTARAAGKVTVAVVGDKLLTTVSSDVQPGTTQVPLTVGNNWGSGAYVVATFRRPLDARAHRMPNRSIGVRWFSIDRAAHTLTVDMKLPALIRPRSALQIPLTISGLVPTEEARVVVAAIDVGILNLTNYKPPAPDDHYLGQRRLAMEIRDLYGQLIDGMQGTRGPIRTGGDEAEELRGAPPTQPPLALYSGLVTVGSDGNATVSFDIPDFTGSVRVMAVAWSKTKIGRASADVIVRDTVVLTATLPRFLLIGDRSTLRVDLDNVEGPAGDFSLAITGDSVFKLDGNANRTVKLAANQRNGVGISFTALSHGTGTITVHMTGPGGLDLQKSYKLSVKPAARIATRRTVQSIAAGGNLPLTANLLTDFAANTGSVALSIGPSNALDAATLVEALDHYPFECSEQLTSRALPLLYAGELLIDPKPESAAAITEAISRLLARQSGEGLFRLWSVANLTGDDNSDSGDDIWLDSYVTDFLTRAREHGFAVSDVAFRLALDHLKNFLSLKGDINKIDLAEDGTNLAYVYYVLTRNKLAPVSDLKTVYERGLSSIPTALARAQIAAALALLGNGADAGGAFDSANAVITGKAALGISRADYGSDLRDAAAVVALASESGAIGRVPNAIMRINDARTLSAETSTNEGAWMMLAALGLASQGAAIKIDVAGVPHTGPIYKRFAPADLAKGVQIANSSDQTLQAVVSVTGYPINPEPAVDGKGFKIERLYYAPDGKIVDPSKAKQNQRFVVVLRIIETKPQFGHLIVSDYLPAGFEIDNPALVSSGGTKTLAWIDHPATTVSSEFRDDRFTAAIDRKADDDSIFAVSYVARAVSPGHYSVPQARVEDMYRTDRYGRTKSGVLDIAAAK
jgi:alpha-2-macroglobulin